MDLLLDNILYDFDDTEEDPYYIFVAQQPSFLDIQGNPPASDREFHRKYNEMLDYTRDERLDISNPLEVFLYVSQHSLDERLHPVLWYILYGEKYKKHTARSYYNTTESNRLYVRSSAVPVLVQHENTTRVEPAPSRYERLFTRAFRDRFIDQDVLQRLPRLGDACEIKPLVLAACSDSFFGAFGERLSKSFHKGSCYLGSQKLTLNPKGLSSVLWLPYGKVPTQARRIVEAFRKAAQACYRIGIPLHQDQSYTAVAVFSLLVDLEDNDIPLQSAVSRVQRTFWKNRGIPREFQDLISQIITEILSEA